MLERLKAGLLNIDLCQNTKEFYGPFNVVVKDH